MTTENSGVGRASYTVREIAERNSLSAVTIYREIERGALAVCNIGAGGRRGLRITAAAEAAWLDLCTHRPRERTKIGGKPRREEAVAA